MRIANKILTDRFANNVNNALDLMNRYNNEIATGKRVTMPSDAPESISLILQFKRSLANVKQYGKNIDAGLSFLRATNDALLASVEQGRLARKLAVNAANDPTLFSDSAITGLVNDISGMKEEVLAQANTQLSGKYIFSGYSTKTMAYGTTSNGYRGDTFSILAKTSDNNTVATNVTGDVAFRESRVSGKMQNLTNPIGGVTEVYFDNNVPAAAGDITTSVAAPGTYNGSDTGNYRVIVNTANATIGEVGGLVLDLQFDDGSGAGYVTVATQAAVGGVAATETISLTNNGLTFDVAVDLTGATQTLAGTEVLNSFDVAGDVAFTISDGTNTSAAIVFNAGTTYTSVQVKAVIDAAIAAGTPQAPTISFDYDVDGNPIFSIDPKDSTGTMEFVDLSTGSNQSSRSRIEDMFNVTAGFKNIFGVLDDLNQAILDKSAEEVEIIIERLDNVEGEMLKSTSIIGARERSLLNNKRFLQKVKDEKLTLLADLEDSDPTEAITKLTNQQTAYDAILYYGSLIQRKSLLDYLR